MEGTKEDEGPHQSGTGTMSAADTPSGARAAWPLLRVRDARYEVTHPTDTPAAHRRGSTGPDADSLRHVTVFSGIGLDVRTGEILDVTGPSGSGKSSLLETIARLRENGTARLWLDGIPADEIPPQEWRRRVATVLQKPVLLGSTVREALLSPWVFRVFSSQPAPRRSLWRSWERRRSRSGHPDGPTPRGRAASTLLGADPTPKPDDGTLRKGLDDLGLADIELERETTSLSGGQLARVSLLRTLLTRPRILLADEIDAALDDESAHLEGLLVARICRERGMAAIRVRHRAPDGFATRTLVLDARGLHAIGPDQGHDDHGKENAR